MSKPKRRSYIPVLVPVVLLLCLGCGLVGLVPYQARRVFGPPEVSIGPVGLVRTSIKLVLYEGVLTRPLDPAGVEQTFRIESGESVYSVAARLEQSGLIASADAFVTYVVYTGLDTSIQAGEYQLSPAMSPVGVAYELQDATSEQVAFVVLPGWRMEEIAASLPTSGLGFTPEEFLAAAGSRPTGFQFLNGAISSEGFLYPDTYILQRNISAEALVAEFIRNFNINLTAELKQGFTNQGLDVYQAVILASIVQREAVEAEEQPLIASVFLNRLAAGMKLETDPTVQYAIGYNEAQATWWTNPLSLQDLEYDSAYNTYIYAGLPPGPIANPGLTALQAVAFPAETSYYYFRARCDGTGLHSFSETFEQHIENGCQ